MAFVAKFRHDKDFMSSDCFLLAQMSVDRLGEEVQHFLVHRLRGGGSERLQGPEVAMLRWPTIGLHRRVLLQQVQFGKRRQSSPAGGP